MTRKCSASTAARREWDLGHIRISKEIKTLTRPFKKMNNDFCQQLQIKEKSRMILKFHRNINGILFLLGLVHLTHDTLNDFIGNSSDSILTEFASNENSPLAAFATPH